MLPDRTRRLARVARLDIGGAPDVGRAVRGFGRSTGPEMGESMNAGPPRVLQAVVGSLLPPASREHVLGDLEERFKQSGSAVQYLSDAIGAMPYVIWGQAQRNVDARLLAVEALALTASFAAAAYRLWS